MKCIKIITAITALLLLTGMALGPSHAFGETDTDNQARSKPENLYQVSFFSLKPGHSIGMASLLLEENGVLTFTIEKESLARCEGTYQIDRSMFEATVQFTLKRDARYRYSLFFKGLWLLDMAAGGIARLTERSPEGKEIQTIPFLFIIQRPKETPSKKAPKPFWMP